MKIHSYIFIFNIVLICLVTSSAFAKKSSKISAKETVASPAKISNAKNIWINKETNLMWQNDDYKEEESNFYNSNTEGGKVFHFEGAQTYCKNLHIGGFHDWRLPKNEELVALFSKKESLKNLPSDAYEGFWSSTETPEDSSSAQFVDYYNGNTCISKKSYSLYVRCVRNK